MSEKIKNAEIVFDAPAPDKQIHPGTIAAIIIWIVALFAIVGLWSQTSTVIEELRKTSVTAWIDNRDTIKSQAMMTGAGYIVQAAIAHFIAHTLLDIRDSLRAIRYK